VQCVHRKGHAKIDAQKRFNADDVTTNQWPTAMKWPTLPSLTRRTSPSRRRRLAVAAGFAVAVLVVVLSRSIKPTTISLNNK